MNSMATTLAGDIPDSVPGARREYFPARQQGPDLDAVVAAAFPGLLRTLRHMRDVTGWLADGETALDTLWAVPEHGAASLAHVAGQVGRLEDVIGLMAALFDRPPAPPPVDLAAAFLRAVTRERIRARHDLRVMTDRCEGARGLLSERDLTLFVAAAALLAGTPERRPAPSLELGAAAAGGGVCLWLEVPDAGFDWPDPQSVLEHASAPGLPPMAALGLASLWLLAAEHAARLLLSCCGNGSGRRLELRIAC